MLIPIVTTVGIAAVTAWLGFLAVRYLLPVVPNPATSVRAARQAARDRITRDPLDYVRAWVARIAPSRLKLEQREADAQAAVEQATEREAHILTSFKDGKEPKFGFKVFAIAMFAAWLFVVLPAVIIIDFPIVMAVSGDSVLAAVFGCLLLIVVPVIFSLLLGFVFEKWRGGETLYHRSRRGEKETRRARRGGNERSGDSAHRHLIHGLDTDLRTQA